ncbi:MAG: type I-U CRISPR-associated helicase/endonuclease Cas3 [Planctomycetota bacterium]|nr:MAG: type I-U CRISPR-associated helicase/endonuclease Cas3 [Planctomycetota bacterium]
MCLTVDRFGEFFQALWGYEPFPWQARLARQVVDPEQGWPDCIDLPTASGKTACIDVAVFALACQADVKTCKRTVGRRIFFTVNRRVIVDEAFERAKALAQKLLDAKEENGILKEVAVALQQISGDAKTLPLAVAQLRGGVYRDRAWARSLAQPMVVCTTADQLGSRLLFRGYGVSPSAAPIHAALCGCDSLVLLDEAHVTRAFSQTMQLLTRYQKQHATAPPMRFVQMTATPEPGVKNRFGLDDADRRHPILKARQQASKPTTLIKLGKKDFLAKNIASLAWDGCSESRKAVGIIVNRVQTAREVVRLIREKVDQQKRNDNSLEADLHLVIGRMRPIDRDDLQAHLHGVVGPGRPDVFKPERKPVFVVATQCLEVGADYDFDALVTECASIDALRQRFGRLNRRGRKRSDGTPLEVNATIVVDEQSLKGDDPIYGDAIKRTWEWLWSTKDDNNQVDFGIEAFQELWKDVGEEKRAEMLAPAVDAAVLLPAHLDALCQTNPQPVPSPDVCYFIHGPQRDMAEVNVCWRADMGDDPHLWPEIVRLLPPTSIECMTVPLWEFQQWMRGESGASDRDADVPVAAPEEKKHKTDAPEPLRAVLVWRWSRNEGGNQADESNAKQAQQRTEGRLVIRDPALLRAGDTVVMPVKYGNWNDVGHIPATLFVKHEIRPAELPENGDCSIDVAERATRQAKRRVALRIHSAFEGTEQFRGLADAELRRTLVEQNLIPPAWNEKGKPAARLERHPYPGGDPDSPQRDEIVIFQRLLDPADRLIEPIDDEDDGEDNLNDRDRVVLLADHSQHVNDRMAASLGVLHVDELGPTLETSSPLHDIGKADIRFLALLARTTPYEAMMLPALLAKDDGRRLTNAEKAAARARAGLPAGFRHEMLSMQLVEHRRDELAINSNVDFDLLLHLLAAHHGYARPFAPVVIDDNEDDKLHSIEFRDLGSLPELTIAANERKSWTPAHRLDSGVAERFWKLTRKHGWWGLAWLESILRLADQQASAAEQEQREHAP